MEKNLDMSYFGDYSVINSFEWIDDIIMIMKMITAVSKCG